MGLFDKLTGKSRRALIEARLAAETEIRLAAEAEAAAKQQQTAEKRRARQEAKKTKQEKKIKQTASVNPDKELATQNGEPYIAIVKVELDPDNIGNGAFELDWNDKFIANLVRAGYQLQPGEAENVIVDRWFQEVCRNILAENYEQWEANYATMRRVETKDLGSGKSIIG